MELVAGTLLTDAQLTDTPIPGPGQSLVGLGLAEDRLPAGRIKPGSAITLVATPVASAVPANNQQAVPPQTFSGTVVDVRRGTRTGTLLVNVVVSTVDSAAVAALAASDRIVIVLGQG